MNKILLLSTAATTLLNFYTWAERDSFDMSLNGYFDKDYCELHLSNPNPTITFDFSSKTPQPVFFISDDLDGPTQPQLGYSFFGVDTGTHQSVTCSPGTYNINLLTQDQGSLVIDGYGTGNVFARIYFDNTFWAEEPVRYLNPAPGTMLNLPLVSIDTPREVVRFEYTFNFTFSAENLGILPTAINTQPSWFSILIDKVD